LSIIHYDKEVSTDTLDAEGNVNGTVKSTERAVAYFNDPNQYK